MTTAAGQQQYVPDEHIKVNIYILTVQIDRQSEGSQDFKRKLRLSIQLLKHSLLKEYYITIIICYKILYKLDLKSHNNRH